MTQNIELISFDENKLRKAVWELGFVIRNLSALDAAKSIKHMKALKTHSSGVAAL